MKNNQVKCTCNRKDLEKDEHYINCPVVLTPEVLAILGFKNKKKEKKILKHN